MKDAIDYTARLTYNPSMRWINGHDQKSMISFKVRDSIKISITANGAVDRSGMHSDRFQVSAS